jgi:hypothetical protein
LSEEFLDESAMVWPFVNGTIRGQSLEPLYSGAPGLTRSNPVLYSALTLIDAIRIGQARERKRAVELLDKIVDDIAK